MNRRNFLKVTAATAAMAAQEQRLFASNGSHLPSVPSLADLASVSQPHVFTDLFNLPIAMNDWGFAQSVKSVSGINAVGFPPYACCGKPEIPWSPGFLITCDIILNDRLLTTWEIPGNVVTYKWFPHCVLREQLANNLRFCTEMFLPQGRRAVCQTIEIQNVGAARQNVQLGFDMRAAVTKRTSGWFSNLKGEGDNKIEWNQHAGRLTFESRHTAAASAQGIHPPANRVVGGNVLAYSFSLASGEKRVFNFVNAVADSPASANQMHDQLQADFSAEVTRNEAAFERLLKSAFTPGNSDFSGYLPELHTTDETLWNLYHNGFKNLLTARRYSPDSVYGPTFITLGGHVLPTLSFPWDTALSSFSLALLEPQPLRNLVEVWFQQDMHNHLATDYISGQGVGPWYGVNDMAIVRCARDYLRVTGDMKWLDKKIGDRIVLEHLYYHATYWKQLETTDHGLGDYGKIQNLLEVVSTYLHEVAGMNAGNVSSMRFVADLLERRGDEGRAKDLRQQATSLAGRINSLLYVDDKGWWRCGQPDGTFNEVRHCYDFHAVLDNMYPDLSAKQKKEMAAFFWEQLASKKWMRALASGDPDATWNIRPDHSCLGAYSAWPPMSAKGLFKIDDPARIAVWLREVAKAGNQGPIGQAHFVEDVMPPVQGGACKASDDEPYIEDWSSIAGGAFTDLVLDSIFGVDMTLFDGVKVTTQLAHFDPNARLEGLFYQGAKYTVSRAGAVKQS